MKAVVLLLIIQILVEQGLCEDITLSLCSKGTIKWTSLNSQTMYQLQLCTFDSTCYKSVNPIKFERESNVTTMMCEQCTNDDCSGCNVSDVLHTFNCSKTEYATSPQDCSEFTSTSALSNNSPSTKLTQDILIALLALLAVLLAIVTAGWVCTCWTMKKRRRAMNINTTNIR